MFYSNYSGMPVFPPGNYTVIRNESFCITGHREKSIVPYRNDVKNYKATVFAVKAMLERYIDVIMDSGYRNLLSGLAEGIDLWAADYIVKCIEMGKRYNLIGVMPYMKHADRFSSKSKEILVRAEEMASLLITTNNNPEITYGRHGADCSPLLYRDRNYFLVDHSSLVLAFLNDDAERSGTAQTVRYAQRKGVPVIRFSIHDVYRLMEQTQNDMTLFEKELNKIKIDIPRTATRGR